MTSDGLPDRIVASWEDYRPHPDPEKWERTWTATTQHPCPVCGIAIGLVFGSPDLEGLAREMMEDYPVTVPDGFTDGYEVPVYIYCDAPQCDFQGVVEWYDILPHLDAWMTGDAPTWSDVTPDRGDLNTEDGE